MNIWDWIILLGIAALVIPAVRRIRKRKTGNCCGTCDACTQVCKEKRKGG